MPGTVKVPLSSITFKCPSCGEINGLKCNMDLDAWEGDFEASFWTLKVHCHHCDTWFEVDEDR